MGPFLGQGFPPTPAEWANYNNDLRDEQLATVLISFSHEQFPEQLFHIRFHKTL